MISSMTIAIPIHTQERFGIDDRPTPDGTVRELLRHPLYLDKSYGILYVELARGLCTTFIDWANRPSVLLHAVGVTFRLPSDDGMGADGWLVRHDGKGGATLPVDSSSATPLRLARVGTLRAEEPIGTVVTYSWGGRHYQAKYEASPTHRNVIYGLRRYWLGIGPTPFWSAWEAKIPPTDMREEGRCVPPNAVEEAPKR